MQSARNYLITLFIGFIIMGTAYLLIPGEVGFYIACGTLIILVLITFIPPLLTRRKQE